MKKICLISDTHEAFDDRIYWKEALSLTRSGFDVVHLCVGESTDTLISEHGIRIIQLKQKLFPRNRYLNLVVSLLPFINLHSRIYSAARKEHAHYYHLHDIGLLKIIRRLKALPWNPKIIHCIRESYADMIRDYAGNSWPNMAYSTIKAWWIEKWEIRKIRLADRIITIDDATFRKFSGIMHEKVSLVYNFSSIFPDSVPEEKKVYDLIYTGGITPQRGILQLLEAVRLVKTSLPNINLLLLGRVYNPAFKTLLIRKLIELQIETNVTIKESVPHPEVKAYLMQSKIGLVTLLPIPKFQKNIPIKQFEYMAFGLPVIGSNLPPIKNFIEPVKAGIIVDPENPHSIADAVIKLLTDKLLYSTMSLNGMKAASEKYTWTLEEIKLVENYRMLD